MLTNQTLDLLDYLLGVYNIDSTRIYISGCSGGGETLSLVMQESPELFASALHISSQWDGSLNNLIEAKTPIYMVIGEHDEYYGSSRIGSTYEQIRSLYLEKGLGEEEINQILCLDVKSDSYFSSSGMSYQHGGEHLFAYDEGIQNWFFSKSK